MIFCTMLDTPATLCNGQKTPTISLLFIAFDLGSIVVEIFAFSSLVDDAGANSPVPEMLPLITLLGVT